jgi:uroporphyrinogen decarboxylase
MNKILDVIEGKQNYAVFPIIGADHCVRLLNLNFSEVADDGRKLAEILEYGYNLYGYDMLLVFSDPYVEAQAMGCQVEFSPYPTLVTAKTDKKIDRTPAIIEATKILKQKLNVPIFVSIKGPFSLAAFLTGIDKLLRMLVKDEEAVKEAINQALEFQKKYLSKLLALGANIFLGDPLASASVISPDMFEKFAFQPLRVLVDEIKDKGLIAGIHICGDTRPIIPMLDSLKTDILSIEDITLVTNTTRMGGVSTQTILSGDLLKIRKEVQLAKLQNYIIIATACDVPPETSPDSIKEMIRYAN